MNTKLSRILDEIKRTEEKIATWQEHLGKLNIRRKQLEDAEIIKSVRAMKLEGREMLAFLEQLQSGGMPAWQDRGSNAPWQGEDKLKEAGNSRGFGEVFEESEDKENEEKD